MVQDQDIALNPIIIPDPIPFTMDTFGWKFLFVILFLLLLFFAYKFYIKYRQNAYRREAVIQIQKLITNNDKALHVTIAQIMFLLKQTALQTYGRKLVASLEGDKWLTFLDSKLHQSIFMQHKEVIAAAIYKNEFNKSNAFKITDFANNSINWIKHHA